MEITNNKSKILDMFGGQLQQIPCTFCGSPVPRYPSQQINPKSGLARIVVKCKKCRRVDPTILFWRLVKKSGHPKGCWEWQGSLNRDGYGNFHHRNLGEYRAHRISWRLENKKKIPKGMNVCHAVECHNRKCVNPSHLYLGTVSDNTFDQISNGTHSSFSNRGERCRKSKLTREGVLAIYARYSRGNVKTLAQELNVSVACIRDVWMGRSWKHLLPFK